MTEPSPETGSIDRIDAFVRDLESIPDVLERTIDIDWLLDALAAATRRRYDRVLLAGLGSSRFAAMLVEDLFLGGAAKVVVQPAGADRALAPDEHLLTIAISASGGTREVVDTAQRNKGEGTVIAITRNASSPLAAAAHAVAVLPVDAESSGVSCTTFVATVAALLRIGVSMPPAPGSTMVPEAVPEGLRLVADATRELLASRDSWLPPALEALDGVEDIAVLAPWSQRGAAEQAALHLRECPRRSAAAYETADWLHIGIYTALPGSAVLLFEGSPSDGEVERVVADRGACLVRVPGPEGLSRTTAASLLAAELWRRVAERPRV